MLCFPNAKINIGLFVTGKRPDGYHTIETIFYPVPLKDALEAVKAEKASFAQTGIKIDSAPDDNLVMKAHKLISLKRRIPELSIYLKKAIPYGAGLGGGSADAAFALKLINDLCELGISAAELEKMASEIGADCSFFIRNKPVLATGVGDEFAEIGLSLEGYTILIVKPPFSISTKEAYAAVEPREAPFPIRGIASMPVKEWKDVLVNDFEKSAFAKYPAIKQIKDALYAQGAEYAAMSGSGSAVFGLFKKTVSPSFPNCFVWKGTLE